MIKISFGGVVESNERYLQTYQYCTKALTVFKLHFQMFEKLSNDFVLK